nr:uncharacterized protein LOC129270771 isoform X2 [Lytechinus pictus]XP_054764074.1 uncharacterized protein LOC129270771 isoform X2 [Lytechinus pictus]
MSRNALRIIIDLNIEAVTCPGVVLKDRQDVYLSVCMLGFQKRTLCLPPFFPLLFHQKFRFERTYANCGDPAHLAHVLQFEDVLIELIQLDEDFNQDGTVLAFYQLSTRDFLYPEDSMLPRYAESDREVLMNKKIWFTGLSPKLEFSCKTTIHDTSTPALDYYRDRVAELEDTNEDYVVVTPSKTRGRKKKSLKRTKSYEAPTISSTMKASVMNTGMEDRPPFIIKRKDTHNRATSPYRARSPSPRRPASAPPNRPRTPISFRTGPPEITGNSSEYISEADCRICRIYQRYFGRRYWGHKKYFHPNNGIKFTSSEQMRNTIRDEELERILSTRVTDVDTESSEDLIDSMNGLSVSLPPVPGPAVDYARLPYSPQLSRSPRLSRSRSRSPSLSRARSRSRSLSPSRRYARSRSRSMSPILARPSLRERLSPRPGSPSHADLIHHRVQRALDSNYLDDSDSSVTSEEALGALRSSLNGSSLSSYRYSSLY